MWSIIPHTDMEPTFLFILLGDHSLKGSRSHLMKYSSTEIYTAISDTLNNLSTKDDVFMHVISEVAVQLLLLNSSCNEKYVL
jgi:hypothetical protein